MSTDTVMYSGHSTSGVPVLRRQGESPQEELLALCRASLMLCDVFILILMPCACSFAEQGRPPENLGADPKSQTRFQPRPALSCPAFSDNMLS